MQEALLSLLLPQHLVVAMWRVHSHGLEREAVLSLRTGWKREASAWGCSGQGGEGRNPTGTCYRVPLGTQSRAADGRNASTICSTPAQPGPEALRQAGCKHRQAQTISHHATAWVLGDSAGMGNAAPLPVAPRGTASSGPSPQGHGWCLQPRRGSSTATFGFTTASLGDCWG